MAFLARGLPGAQARVSLSDMTGFVSRHGSKVGSVRVNETSAMAHSAVWAAIRLRGDLISTTPIDVYRPFAGRRIEMPTTGFLAAPYGDPLEDPNAQTMPDWLYRDQVELDRSGVSCGIITARDGYGKPREVELISGSDIALTIRGPKIVEARAYGALLPLKDLWITNQYTLSGHPVGLSAVMAAARSIGGYLSAQQAAADHWAAGLTPGGMLKNTERRVITRGQIDEAKQAFAAAVQDRGLFVHGSEWEWTPVEVEGVNSTLIDELRWSVSDIARFFGVPGDLIDAAQSGTSVTYANISQRTLQFLVNYLGPIFIRREVLWSRKVLPESWFLKFNTDALLRMDPEQRVRLTARRLQNRMITNDEARALDDSEPLSDEEIARLNLIYGEPTYKAPTDTSSGQAGASSTGG